MTYDTGAGAAAVAATTIIARAVKASGAIIRVEPGDFKEILNKEGRALVIKAKGGFFKPNYQYLTSYKGFVFFTKSSSEMMFSPEVEFINAKEIWIPD
ncbi:MAG: hypothetical protein PHE50_02245 [Dehalococcoidales bacterium]|nr:hypothetical protein [Dehalococcoidales bacterium]